MRELLDSAKTSCKKILPLQKDGVLFAVNDGNLKGEFLVYVEDEGPDWIFFAFFELPEFHLRRIPKKAFMQGIELGIVDTVEPLPKDVLEFIGYQYQITKLKS